MILSEFFDSLKGKTVGFCGIARSNMPLMEMFYNKGAKIVARDKNEDISHAEELIKKVNAKTVLGENYLKDIDEDIILRAPGIPYLLPEFKEAKEKGVVVTSEMEIFMDLCPCKVYAVTGSDGKTTTTSIIAEMLKKEGKRVHLGGNIGKPLLPDIEDISVHDVAVVELSSFQLISMRKSPDVCVITNLAPNHLDVHKDMEEYVDAKKNIYLHQNAFSRTVLNMDNELTYSLRGEVRGDLWEFSRREIPDRGTYAKDGFIYCGKDKIMAESEIKIPGVHNVENYLAAIAAVWGEVSIDSIVAVAKTFGGVAHRAEFVREFDGVKYYNDSIASSPSRAISGTLSLYNKKIIMIAGGADKGVPFDELGEIISQKVKVLILIKPVMKEGFKPSASDKISSAVTGSTSYFNFNPVIIRVKTMEEAVQAANDVSKEGDVVSLCPACTSFDMYKSFEQRGNHYKELVYKLHEFK